VPGWNRSVVADTAKQYLCAHCDASRCNKRSFLSRNEARLSDWSALDKLKDEYHGGNNQKDVDQVAGYAES
jgi:hypothetical protein